MKRQVDDHQVFDRLPLRNLSLISVDIGMNPGAKPDALHRQGPAWFCTNGIPSDVTVEVGGMLFHLHKFPLLSMSGLLEKLIKEKKNADEEAKTVIKLHDLPGGAEAFELAAKFCYGAKLELTSSNIVGVRCAAEHLQMTEDVAQGNVIVQTEIFFNQVVLHSWSDSIEALRSCDDLIPHAEDLHLVGRCIDSLAAKACCTNPNLFGWPASEDGGGAKQSPGGSVLWNGISTGARAADYSTDWWYEDASGLSFPFYKRLISALKARNVKVDIVAGSLTFYAKRYLPALNRRHGLATQGALSDDQQRHLVEETNKLLPLQKGVVPTKILLGLLRTAIILRASSTCISNLERRIGMQLDQAELEDLLFPTFAYSMEALYNVDCVERMLHHFLAMETSPRSLSNEQSITNVAKLIDGYLAEIAPDVNLKPAKFQMLASAVPDYARPLDDGLYRAIDMYLKAHPWLSESEKEQVCRLIDCQKLSLEACTHAAQNERLPLRLVVQVLFFEQLQLRTSVAGCLLVSDNLDGNLRPPGDEGCNTTTAAAAGESKDLKVGMDDVRMRVYELEQECTTMKEEIAKLGRGRSRWIDFTKKLFRFKLRLQLCRADEDSVEEQQVMSRNRMIQKLQNKIARAKQQLYEDDA